MSGQYTVVWSINPGIDLSKGLSLLTIIGETHSVYYLIFK